MLWVIYLKKQYRGLILIILFVLILGVSINVSAETTCSKVISQDLLDDLNDYVYTPIQWLTPVALIVLTSIDFAGVVFGGKKEGLEKAKNNFLKRAVAAIIIFLVPELLKLIASFINNQSIRSCIDNMRG